MRLTRRAFIQASCATAAMLAAGCATQATGPVTNAMAVRKARPAGPAKGDWVASTCQGCTQWCAIQIFVQEGRAVRVRGNPLSKTNHGYVLPARAPDPAAGLRSGPDQGADEAHQSGQGARRGSEVRADHLGRGARHRRRRRCSSCAGTTRRTSSSTCAAATRRRRPSCSTARCPRSTAPPTTSRTARSAPKPRRWARA